MKTVRFLWGISLAVLLAVPVAGSRPSPDIQLSEIYLPLVASIERQIWSVLSSSAGDLPAPAASEGQAASLILDIDGQGGMDFVIASWGSPEALAWYRKEKTGWVKRLVEDFDRRIEAGGAAYDIDQDGDADLVFGEASAGNHIWWWENPFPQLDQPWERYPIKSWGEGRHHDQAFGDFDQDGQIELASWNQLARALLLFELPLDPRSGQDWPWQVIYTWTGTEHEGLQAADIDQDGTIDLVGAGRWWHHQPGGQYQVDLIDDEMRKTRVAAGQLIPGGWLEVVFSPADADGVARWYEWTDSSWQGHVLIPQALHTHTLDMGDLDQDGWLDILVGEMGIWGAGSNPDPKVWAFYGDGLGGFQETIILRGQGIHEGRLGDLDGDGWLDVLVKPYLHHIPRVDVLVNGLP